MSQLPPVGGNYGPAVTMTSLEIAELTDKEHRNVMRDIRVMLVELHGEGGLLNFEHTHQNPQNGQFYPIFKLPAREVKILVTGYSITLRARVIDRLEELEARVGKPDPMAVLSDPAAMRGLLLTYTEKVIELQNTVDEQAPKAAFHDQVVQSERTYDLGETAKLIGTGRTRLTRWMRENRWINKRAEPYQKRIEAGLLDLKYSRPWTHPEKGEMRSITTMVTGKGLATLQRIFPAEKPDLFAGQVLA